MGQQSSFVTLHECLVIDTKLAVQLLALIFELFYLRLEGLLFELVVLDHRLLKLFLKMRDLVGKRVLVAGVDSFKMSLERFLVLFDVVHVIFQTGVGLLSSIIRTSNS